MPIKLVPIAPSAVCHVEELLLTIDRFHVTTAGHTSLDSSVVGYYRCKAVMIIAMDVNKECCEKKKKRWRRGGSIETTLDEEEREGKDLQRASTANCMTLAITRETPIPATALTTVDISGRMDACLYTRKALAAGDILFPIAKKV